MVKENPRVMHGVIITVYVDRETTTVRSFQANPEEEERIVRRRLKNVTGRTRGSDRKACLMAYARELRAASLAGETKRDGGECWEPQRPPKWKKKKKRKWIRRVVARFRVPFHRLFRRKNPTWRYRRFVPEGEESQQKSNACDYDIWKKLKHMLGGVSRCGCNKRGFA